MNEAEAAWLAGMYEGEGCLYSRITQRRRYPRIRIRMTDEDVVRKIHTISGVGLFYESSPPKENRQQLYVWEVNKLSDVKTVFRHIYPWLGKRRRAKVDELMGDLYA